jgi:hypothetical protein
VTENGRMDSMLKHFSDRTYDYFIFNKRNRNREYIMQGSFHGRYELVTFYENKPNSNIFSSLIKKMGFSISEDYSCYIYKYTGIKKEQPLPGQ